jgi:hypothetical protein
VRVPVLTAAIMKMKAFWHITLSTLVKLTDVFEVGTASITRVIITSVTSVYFH